MMCLNADLDGTRASVSEGTDHVPRYNRTYCKNPEDPIRVSGETPVVYGPFTGQFDTLYTKEIRIMTSFPARKRNENKNLRCKQLNLKRGFVYSLFQVMCSV